MSTTTNATKIAALLPGRSVTLSASNGVTVTAERSGDGKILRIVRSTREGFEVIRSEAWGAR